jgi:hypothetical protein
MIYGYEKNKDFILSLYSSKNTVFTIGEIALLLGDSNCENLKSRINYYVKTGKLLNLRKSVYAKQEYNPLELAIKIYVPSYISLETVLEKEGVIFQKYETIFVVSYLSRKIQVNRHKIQYRRIKEEILINEVKNYLGIPMLVMQKEDIFAHKLVAFLDRKSIANRDVFDLWFFFKKNWEIAREIVELRTGKDLKDYIKLCVEKAKNLNETYILQGLGEVLDVEQKKWVKNNLKDDLIFLMRNYLESKTQ